MRIRRATLRAARLSAGNPDLNVWYVEPKQPVVFGYAILPDASEQELPATKVQITMLDAKPTTAACTLRRSSKGECLYWIVAQQGPGAVWYRWTAPDGTANDFLAQADDQPETALARAATAERIRRLQMIWKIAHRTGQPQPVVDRVCKRVNNKLNTALTVFRLVDQLLDAHGRDEDKVQKELQELLLRTSDDRHLLYQLRQAGANSVEPAAIVSILRGAQLALGLKER